MWSRRCGRTGRDRRSQQALPTSSFQFCVSTLTFVAKLLSHCCLLCHGMCRVSTCARRGALLRWAKNCRDSSLELSYESPEMTEARRASEPKKSAKPNVYSIANAKRRVVKGSALELRSPLTPTLFASWTSCSLA